MRNCACGGELVAGFIPDFEHMATWAAPAAPDTEKSILERGVSLDGEAAPLLEAHRFGCGQIQFFALRPAPLRTSPV